MDELRKHPQLGRILKQLRKARRLKHTDVSAAVWGDSAKWNWYSKIENRANAYPSDEELDRILGVLGSSREAVAALARSTWSDEVRTARPAAAVATAAPAPQAKPSADDELRSELVALTARLTGEHLREAVLDARTWLARQELGQQRSR